MRSKILAATALTLGSLCWGDSAFGAAALTTLQTWATGNAGYVFSQPTLLPSGALYGVLSNGPNAVSGSIYALTPPKSGAAWTVATISSFTGGATGGYPLGTLVADSAGNLYGTSFGGGKTASPCSYVNGSIAGCGTVFKLTPPVSGTTWTRTVLYSFAGGTDGIGPLGGLAFDTAGNLYGVTEWGGCTATLTYPNGCGTVFKLTPPKSGASWAETVLYRFQGGASDGAYPNPQLLLDSANNIYGTSLYGGAANCGSTSGDPDGRCGVAFELVNKSGAYAMSVLHSFTDGADGSLPGSGFVKDSAGNLYGTTLQGGTVTVSCQQFGHSGCGTVYKLAPPSGSVTSWTKSTPHIFAGTDGAFPASLLINSAGVLYGVASENAATSYKCSFYCGDVFKLSLSGSTWTDTTVHAFTDVSDNAGPQFGLAVNSAGTLYGVSLYNVTSTVYAITGAAFAKRHPHYH